MRLALRRKLRESIAVLLWLVAGGELPVRGQEERRGGGEVVEKIMGTVWMMMLMIMMVFCQGFRFSDLFCFGIFVLSLLMAIESIDGI